MTTAVLPEVPASTKLNAALALLPGLGFSPELIGQLTATEPSWESPLAPALAVIGAFPALVEKHASRDIPFPVTAATLRDLERRILEYRAANGVWGFDRLEWMRNHLSGNFFEIGRLQFMIGQWREIFDVHQFPDGESRPLALPDIFCDAQGHPTDEKTKNGFQTSRNTKGGHPSHRETGAILPLAEELPEGSRQIVTGGDPVLHIHIPQGDGFTPETCRESLWNARCFFERHFSEISFKAICCRTWLLDPALRQVLAADSHILAFQRLFQPLAVKGADGRQHLERIFGPGDWRKVPPKTRLQKAARRYLEAGGEFRLSAGFVLWQDILRPL